MAERRNSSKWFQLAPLLLLLLPAVAVIAAERWIPRQLDPIAPAPSLTATATSTIARADLVPSVTPPHLVAESSVASPPAKGIPTTTLRQGRKLPAEQQAPTDLSDAAIAAFDPQTITMLNSHKYWSGEKQALVDGLYDQWSNEKQNGADTESARQQIGWALKGRFMEEY